MKQYIPRPGIVRTKICGVHVLIPSREAFSHCSTIQRLPLLWAATWDGLVNGKTLAETVEFHRILTKKPEEEILQRLETFYTALCEKGFLIEAQEDASDSPKDATQNAPISSASGMDTSPHPSSATPTREEPRS